ncbi:hypothetical protein BDZ45DRAFT_697068 [Acephala macrosclerotiorum]|nr:hypothetical protein BDZ45DRAFT_697068 [Acephala macrosclerotiorum]
MLQSSLYSQQQAKNFLNTSNHFHALEMATFVPISYTYVPTAPRSTSATARRKPTSKQSSILDKLQRSKLSEAELSTPQPVAANDIGGNKLGIRETSTINDGDDNRNDDSYDPPSIEQRLYTTLQKEGFAAEDRRPNNTAFGVGDTIAEERGGSLDDNRSAPGDNSSGSPKDPIVLLGDDDSSTSEAEAEADDGGPRAESAAADEGLLDSLETTIDSTTPAPPSNPDVWHDIDGFLETAQRLRRSAQKPSTFDCMRLRASSSRASSEPLHDHINAAGQCTVRARSEATMSHPARSRNQPQDHFPTDRSAGDEHEPIRPALNSDICDGEEKQRQEEEQEDEDCGNDNEDGRQPQQEVMEDVAAALMTGKVGDTHQCSKKGESPGLANRDSFSKPSQDKSGNHSDRCNGVELKSNSESDDDEGRSRAAKRKRPSSSNGPMHKKRKHHPEQRPTRQHGPHSKPYRHSSKSHSPLDQRSRVTPVSSHGRFKGPKYGSLLRNEDQDEEEPQEQQGAKRRHQGGAEETSSGIHQSGGNECSHDTGDEHDEEPRLAKRRKLPLVSTDVALTPSLEHSPKPCLRQSHGLAPSSTTQSEMDESPPQADHGHLSTPGDDEHHYPPPTSRSPSVTVESAPVVEYREWPFQGFLKRITIGNQTIYNLEFALPRIPEHLGLSLHSEILGAGSRESSAEAVVSHKAVASRKPGKELTKEQESLLAKMVHEDETWTEIRRHFPGHTLQSLKENFFTKQGGKPRKRGRKPGVRIRGT